MKYPILLLALLPISSFAQNSKSLSLQNTATVLSSCSISTTQNINFGVFDPFTPQELTGLGEIAVSCTYGSYSTNISNGTGGNGFVFNYTSLPSGGGGGYMYGTGCLRGMINDSGQKLYYDLYADPSYTVSSLNSSKSEFNYTVPNKNSAYSCTSNTIMANFKTMTFTTNQPQSLKIYGKINTEKGNVKALKPGNYRDQVSVTIFF